VLAEIAFVWVAALAVIAGMIYFLFVLVSERRAHADEPTARIFEQADECSIDAELRVTGSRRAVCVERLEMAARLAKMEMRVNERRKR
jgi:hypothetical protein